MATKKNIKVRDLKPSKDAKGGAAREQGVNQQGVRESGVNLHGTKEQKHGHGHHRQN